MVAEMGTSKWLVVTFLKSGVLQLGGQSHGHFYISRHQFSQRMDLGPRTVVTRLLRVWTLGQDHSSATLDIQGVENTP